VTGTTTTRSIRRRTTTTLGRRIACVLFAVLFAAWCRLESTALQDHPIIVVETSKGSFEIETFAEDAPKSVAHVIDLVKRGFYDGQRVHRALPGFLVQWGDPRSRDPAQESEWGRGSAASSGTPVGAAELPKKRSHTKGAVGLAHPGNPAQADSQLYVTLADRPELNGRYAVIGRVIAGDDVPARLERGDLILRMSVRE
jgi:cyclophilin family peptidyl-prolyl cis-trans isomerase